MKQFTLFVFLIISNCLFGQISKELLTTIKSLEKYPSFYALDKEINGIENKVDKIAKSDELEYLALNGNNVYIKGVAIKILINRNDEKIKDVFKRLINSKDSILYNREHLSSSVSLPAFFFENLSFNNKLDKETQNKIKSDLTEIILNNQPVNISLLNEIHYQIPVNKKYYEKIRNIVIKSNSPSLLVALAKYQNENDIELIKSFKENSFSAIGEFPNDDFLPFLEKYTNHYDEFPYLFAVSKFCNPKGTELISKIVDLKTTNLKNSECNKNYCLKVFYNQIYMNDCKLFYPILEKMWLSHKILSFDILDFYEENHTKEETVDFILSGLFLNGKAELISHNMYDIEKMLSQNREEDLTFGETGKLVKLLNRLKTLSEEKYQFTLNSVISNIDDLETDDFIYQLNDNSNLLKAKNSFIQKMKSNESAYGLLIIINGVKKLGDEKLFNDCFEIIKERRNEFQEKEVWEKSLQEFLRNNKLKL
ncbi:hypothetical protein HX004_07125 [Myroides sp. 1354]|uniref:hypothetical protein n=1 Tax=unclassified Myroides TaxID=2642485 RepID=UPI002576C197|nr:MULTISPECIES: hypothetical protein [unclassified Myroides]MDM1044831.1 hypothetical protein [Myroides sp. R163-1]MDM1055544.1 hypothetical protein [Myroides sp. 1354]MDM1068841.1 hypothetical protein [Myroides sp. 1372]